MGATGDGTTYVTILDCREDGTVWLQVHMPSGSLTRGPYGTPQEVQRAAVALERVARRRWAQHQTEARDAGDEIGGPAPVPLGTACWGQESAEEPPIRPEISRIHRILAHFLTTST